MGSTELNTAFLKLHSYNMLSVALERVLWYKETEKSQNLELFLKKINLLKSIKSVFWSFHTLQPTPGCLQSTFYKRFDSRATSRCLEG